MTRENKELLIKDLSARLPYHLIVHIHDIDVIDYDNYLYPDYLEKMISSSITLKPYLRPMWSMTNEEFGFLQEHLPYDFTRIYSGKFNLIDDIHLGDSISIDDMAFLLDYLNKRHFNYRGLIEKGLAIDATGLNIY